MTRVMLKSSKEVVRLSCLMWSQMDDGLGEKCFLINLHFPVLACDEVCLCFALVSGITSTTQVLADDVGVVDLQQC